MSAVHIEIKNLGRLMDAVSRYPEISRNRIEEALDLSERDVIELSLKRHGIVPYKTGSLSASFEFGRVRGPLYRSIGPTVEYAVYVNEGTKHMKPRKFMERIAERATPKINRNFEKALEAITEDVARVAA
jgi:HK97 gp10 family phage protein